MKLYAELENEEGKRVSLGSNQGISCTVYEGNKKQYSVFISWGDIGDIIDNEGNDLPEAEKMKGSIVTVKEWRNEPDERRAKKHTCEKHGAKYMEQHKLDAHWICRACVIDEVTQKAKE